ncbi:hypothetical protein WA026_000305 [Henosepilachna vigintioctopunctata]|uniref:Germinal-center associated nuclear protein n=1 Tax=Henosepilachna vigintioctopunctata TaxID=420089 RepID=A0AAW1V4Q8_9CUCU
MECCKISCKNIPNIFFEEKNVAKDHFRQFGRIKKMVFKPKSRICTVEYISKGSVQKAMDFGCKFGNHMFEINRDIPLKISRKMKKDDPEWLPDPDVLEELNAMCGGPSSGLSKIYNLRPEVMDVDIKESQRNVSKRQWPALEINKTGKTLKSSISLNSVSEENQELIDLIKKPANNIDDKYKILDARDKLIRFVLKREGYKTGTTKGTCPDMCPEKERILRVIQHQVSIYEQDSSKEMNEALAVKQYSRSSADQEASLPHELRSVTVLQMTMSYLIHKIMNLGDTPDVNIGDWYHFLWDRTRSIRKDITQQELCSQGSVALVEQCARFHIHCSARLVAEEPSVFDQRINTENLTKCLQTLKYMYNDLRLKGEACPNEAEFRAYIILLNLNDANFMWEVQKLQTVVKKSQEVKTAIEIYSALDKNNFIKFFKLVKSSSYLNACILMRYFMQVRIRAITILLKCYTPRITKVAYPLDKLTSNLAFESVSHAIEFLQNCGLTINTSKTGVILDKNLFTTPDFTYAPLDRSINVVESKRNNLSIGEIICQGRLPPTDFEHHIPQNSFGDNNTLNLDQHQELKDLVVMDKPAYKIINKVDKLKNVQQAYKTIKSKNPFVYIRDTQESLPSKVSKIEEKERLTQTSLPVSRPVTSSIFALDNRPKTESKTSYSTNIFGGQSLQNIPPPDILKQDKFSKDQELLQNNSKNLFENTLESNNTIFATSFKNSESLFGQNNLFGGLPPISKTNIFGQINDSKQTEGNNLSIFGNKKAIHINEENNIRKTNEVFNVSPKNEKDFGEIKWDLDSPKTCENDQNTLEDIFFKSSNSKVNELVKNVPKSVGGFPFPNFSSTQSDADKNKKLNIISEILSEKDKIAEQIQKELKEDVRKQEEKDRMNKLDMELEEKRREQENERKLQDAQRMKALNEKKFKEIKTAVEELIPEMLERVEENLRIEKIEEIRKKTQRRILTQTFQVWRNNVLKIKRKRKAVACSPIWACTRSPCEEASELKMESQNLALQNIKRYKYGKSLTLKCNETKVMKKIDFKKLANVISKRYWESVPNL